MHRQKAKSTKIHLVVSLGAPWLAADPLLVRDDVVQVEAQDQVDDGLQQQDEVDVPQRHYAIAIEVAVLGGGSADSSFLLGAVVSEVFAVGVALGESDAWG